MVDSLWVLISALLVFLMQVGFLCLESGRTRSKNNINVAAKNIIDFTVSTSIFWLVGFGIMYGNGFHGLFGTDRFLYGDDSSAKEVTFFLFQLMFCATTVTLVSGAIAERTKFISYILITFILSLVIYPVTGHWVSAGLIEGNAKGWLENLGFIDFAGSTIVHSVGGWVSLAALLIIGSRLGRFSQQHRFPTGSNLPLAAVGVFLIWVGWFGFNGGSALAFSENVPNIILNTCLSAIWGCIAISIVSYIKDGFVDIVHSLNGLIAGLVGITANCFAVSADSAAIIGMVAGVIAYYGVVLLEKYQIDDALGVIPAHLFAGIWGTLAVAIFGDLDVLGTGLTRLEQLGVQAFGVSMVGVYSFFVSYICFYLLNRYYPLRVSHEEELSGLNVVEHKATTELLVLLNEMEGHQQDGEFTEPVVEEPFTEVGQIAKKYNQVIKKVSTEIDKREVAILDFKVSEGRKSAILNSTTDCIISIDTQGSIGEFNAASERTLGYSRDEILGSSFIDNFVLLENKALFIDSLENKFMLPTGLLLDKKLHVDLQRSGGGVFPAEMTVSLSTVGYSVSEYTLQIRDITKENKLKSRLNFLAYQDSLTGLWNRTYLMKELQHKISQAESSEKTIVIYFMDLDNFKYINDTLGHRAGDKLLCIMADRLKNIFRDEDIVARLGGDEFIVAIEGDLSDDVICRHAESILADMRKPSQIEGKPYKTPASIGVATSRVGELSADEILQRADIAMYSAKNNGRDNYVIYNSALGEKASRRANYERLIKVGLEQEQFRMVYQPKVDKSGNIISLESLIRWNHPELGEISPGEFISIAEDSHLIILIGEYVIKQVVDLLSDLRKRNLPVLPISINISGRHLLSQELAPFITKQIENKKISGELLEIEITEGFLIEDLEACIRELQQIKELGITTSIDDFGTGYSSLSYLKRLPLDKLKIDRSFVKDCHVVSQDLEICATIINLAKSLKIECIAEGVELIEQVDALSELGCDLFQGYYFYRPLEVPALLEVVGLTGDDEEKRLG